MSGYTPLFSSLTTGTLCGRWPDIGLWPIILSLSDWRGIVDVTPDYLSRVTGLPVDEVVACMKRFCEPDLYSRSGAEDGRRLILLEEHRPWGWRIVNLKIYRNRASGQDQIEDGRNAAKVKRYKDKKQTPLDTTGHQQTHQNRPDTHSYSYSDSDSDKTGVGGRRRAARSTACRLPTDFVLTEVRRLYAEAQKVDAVREFESFSDYWRAASGASARKHDWDAAWRGWCRKAADFKSGRATSAKPERTGAWMGMTENTDVA